MDVTNDNYEADTTPRKPILNRALKPDAQAFDEIRIYTVPRCKQSEISGDEWRISANVDFYRNGKIVHSHCGLRDVEAATRLLAYLHGEAIDNGHGYFAGEGEFCDQEGCKEIATATFKLKNKYCKSCGTKDQFYAERDAQIAVRKFCNRHKRRGDSSLDDMDDNYELLAPAAA